MTTDRRRYLEFLALARDYFQGGVRRAHPELATQTASPAAAPSRPLALATLDAQARACTRCDLCYNRLNALYGAGGPDATLMVVGDAPDAEDDERGIPFAGEAGRYLDKWLTSIGLSRGPAVFMTTLVK